MRIIAKKALQDHWQRPGREDSRQQLLSWYAIASRAEWKSPSDVKALYGNASLVGNRIVFNICGNKYRLVVYINYVIQRIYIRSVGTHREYDSIDVKEV